MTTPRQHAPRLIVAGGSAGALDALSEILPALPSTFSMPIALLLHQLPYAGSHLAEVIRTRTALEVVEVDDKQPIVPGVVHLAPPNYHLLVEAEGTFALSVDPLVNFSRPAIDVLFESAADAYGPALVGLLLSGASHDGAAGIHSIQRAGGVTLVQSPVTASSTTMPESAMGRCAVDHVLTPAAIGAFLAALDIATRTDSP